MPQVSIASSALREIRERMARYNFPTAVWIIGPMQEDCRAPGSLEESWLIEKLYGPPPRWVLDIVPLNVLKQNPVEGSQRFYIEKVGDISVGLLTSKTVPRLSVELVGDAIRVYELDA